MKGHTVAQLLIDHQNYSYYHYGNIFLGYTV